MIFVTVGTSFPFDRLIRAVEKLVDQRLISDSVFAQVGIRGYCTKSFECVEVLEKQEFDQRFQDADAVIAHAGMGTISTALSLNKPLLVVPRLKEYGELVNGHQEVAARKFARLGHVLAAFSEDQLFERVSDLWTFEPVPRICRVDGVSERVAELISDRMSALSEPSAGPRLS